MPRFHDLELSCVQLINVAMEICLINHASLLLFLSNSFVSYLSLFPPPFSFPIFSLAPPFLYFSSLPTFSSALSSSPSLFLSLPPRLSSSLSLPHLFQYNISDGDFFGNMLQHTTITTADNLQRLRKPVDKTEYVLKEWTGSVNRGE